MQGSMTEKQPKALLESAEERHGRFIAALGDGRIWRYTDGGPGKRRDRRKAKAAKRARKANRR